MPTPRNIGTRDVPLRLARTLSERVKEEWESGELLGKVTPVTRELLTYWFLPPHIDVRHFNFHEGQRQAILNTIYAHEVLKTDSVVSLYEHIDPELLLQLDAGELRRSKYEIPKYAIKMATGTGKTWAMHALLIWQCLNAKREDIHSGRFSKNFLLVAPGVIVYERLLDAFLGKENEQGMRDFERSDFGKFQDLFIPPAYRDEVFGFLQSSVARKEEIGSKVTGDGLIAITNWHLFLERQEDEAEGGTPMDDTAGVIHDVFPIRPGTSGGNALNALDAAYLRGREIDYLAQLPDLVVVNDEAHHIHENRTYGEVEEVEWQKSLNIIAQSKGKSFIQIDFSATPYDTTGSGDKRTKHFFPHIIINFDLKEAIRGGLVKTIAIDKRKEIVDLPELDFRAVRDSSDKPIGLSEGQRLMLRAGLKKLYMLDQSFTALTADKSGRTDKHPKMLVVCEDTNVSPLVEQFLLEEGLDTDAVMRIDSNRKGDVPEDEWRQIRQKLFSLDEHASPKVIVSVLMLREGFDVNNICVIVPLRASTAPILLEQTIGRGLRLMWREPEYDDIKIENRRRLLVEKKEPTSYIDLLTVVEHPAFVQFYDDLLNEGLAGQLENEPTGPVTGDIITVGLRSNYKEYDFAWPVITKDREEELENIQPTLEQLEPFQHFELGQLQKMVAKPGEEFYSEEVTVKTRFGDYLVDANLFTAQSYNEFLQKVLHIVTHRIDHVTARKTREFPVIQVNQVELIRLIDQFIREKLFNSPFDPFEGNNWKLLLLKNGVVTQHIVKEIGKAVFEMQSTVRVDEAIVDYRYFSEVAELRMREKYSVPVAKAIYERLAFPSNRGKLEGAFVEYADRDGNVEALIKVNDFYHTFAHVMYMRSDGLLSLYYPDFLVKTKENVYVIETKADKDLHDPNVKQKQVSTLSWIGRVNQLPTEKRMGREWVYVLLGEQHFYAMSNNGASISEILELARVRQENVEGHLF